MTAESDVKWQFDVFFCESSVIELCSYIQLCMTSCLLWGGGQFRVLKLCAWAVKKSKQLCPELKRIWRLKMCITYTSVWCIYYSVYYSMQNFMDGHGPSTFSAPHQSGKISHSSEELAEGRGTCDGSAGFTQRLAAFSSQVFQIQALEPESLRSVMPEVSLPKDFTGPTSSGNISHLHPKRATGQVDLLRLDALPHGSSCQMLRSLLQKVWDSSHLYQQQIPMNLRETPWNSQVHPRLLAMFIFSQVGFLLIFGQALRSEILDSRWWQRLWMLFLDEKCLLVIQIPPPFEFTPHGSLVAHRDGVVLTEQDMLALWHWYKLAGVWRNLRSEVKILKRLLQSWPVHYQQWCRPHAAVSTCFNTF